MKQTQLSTLNIEFPWNVSYTSLGTYTLSHIPRFHFSFFPRNRLFYLSGISIGGSFPRRLERGGGALSRMDRLGEGGESERESQRKSERVRFTNGPSPRSSVRVLSESSASSLCWLLSLPTRARIMHSCVNRITELERRFGNPANRSLSLSRSCSLFALRKFKMQALAARSVELSICREWERERERERECVEDDVIVQRAKRLSDRRCIFATWESEEKRCICVIGDGIEWDFAITTRGTSFYSWMCERTRFNGLLKCDWH